MTLEECLTKQGELHPYLIYHCYDTSIEKIREFFGNSEIPDKKYEIFVLVSGTEMHDIYGNTGNQEMIILVNMNRWTDYYKYIGEDGYSADSVREYLKEYFNKNRN